MEKYDVIQFNENHKWRGCLGIITEIKDCGENGIRYMIAVPAPQDGTAYIFVMNTENAIEKIRKSCISSTRGGLSNGKQKYQKIINKNRNIIKH